jgi:predicted MPP superfamily phosphohydrolase
MSLKILQLSYLHFGKHFATPDDLATSIESALSRSDSALNGSTIDLIIFTGDLIDGSKIATKEYKNYIETASEFFNKLLEELNYEREHKLTKLKT